MPGLPAPSWSAPSDRRSTALNGFQRVPDLFGWLARSARLAPATAVRPPGGVLAGSGLIGGLTAITFTGLVGIAFLGEPRTERPGAGTWAGVVDSCSFC